MRMHYYKIRYMAECDAVRYGIVYPKALYHARNKVSRGEDGRE